MMKDKYNTWHLVEFLPMVTGKQFQLKYLEIANSKDKIPKASTMTLLRQSNGGMVVEADIHPEGNKFTPIYECFIYYESKINPDAETIPEDIINNHTIIKGIEHVTEIQKAKQEMKIVI